MDVLSRLNRGYKDIVVSICRYAHPYLLHRCFEQLFALMEWSEWGTYEGYYVAHEGPRYILFQHRFPADNRSPDALYIMAGRTVLTCIRSSTEYVTVIRIPSGGVLSYFDLPEHYISAKVYRYIK